MNKDGIKKRFMDILFEPDEADLEESVVEEVPVKSAVQETKKVTREPGFNARDVLYNKKDSTFIDYQAKVEKKKKQEEEPYEFSSQISPIFGMIKEGKKPVTKIPSRVDESMVNSRKESPLDIVPSPIYGYATRESINAKQDVYDAIEETSEEEIHRIFEKEDPQEYRNPYETRTEELSLFDIYEEDNK